MFMRIVRRPIPQHWIVIGEHPAKSSQGPNPSQLLQDLAIIPAARLVVREILATLDLSTAHGLVLRDITALRARIAEFLQQDRFTTQRFRDERRNRHYIAVQWVVVLGGA